MKFEYIRLTASKMQEVLKEPIYSPLAYHKHITFLRETFKGKLMDFVNKFLLKFRYDHFVTVQRLSCVLFTVLKEYSSTYVHISRLNLRNLRMHLLLIIADAKTRYPANLGN